MPEMMCPDHGVKMLPQETRYGLRYFCPLDACDCVCWNHITSSPANKETRQLRSECHKVFDVLWKNGTFKNRKQAYSWLQSIMKLPKKEAHIGLFNKQQCLTLLANIHALVN